MEAAYDFTTQLRGFLPGPHKIWLANPKLSQTIVPTGAYFQTESTLTKAEIEIATNMINGKWCSAYGNYEHEMIGHWAGGLAPETNLIRFSAPSIARLVRWFENCGKAVR